MLGRRLFSRLMKTTVYGQFVAGEDVDSILPNIAKLKDNGVRPILDYATEEDIPDSKEASRSAACLQLPRSQALDTMACVSEENWREKTAPCMYLKEKTAPCVYLKD